MTRRLSLNLGLILVSLAMSKPLKDIFLRTRSFKLNPEKELLILGNRWTSMSSTTLRR
jgi:hypothetical protein